MNAIRLGLAAMAFALGASAAEAAKSLPAIDTEAICRAAERADPASGEQVNRSCVRSERDARDRLAAQWDEFQTSDRNYCTRLATLGGMGSYVQLLTCLEMERDVRALRRRDDAPVTTGSSR